MADTWSGPSRCSVGTRFARFDVYAGRHPESYEYGILLGIPFPHCSNFYTHDVHIEQLKSSTQNGTENCIK